MKLGIYLFSQSNFNPNKKLDVLIERTKYYDEIGIDSIWISDGLTAGPDPSEYPHYETLSLISALSQHTNNVSFGTLASPHSIRSVALYSKMMLTLDHITKGKIIAGIGIGSPNQTEDRYGIQGMDFSDRMKEFEDYTNALKNLLQGHNASSATLSGAEYRANPLPYTKNGPKLLIAGAGEKKTLQQVARYGDMSNIWGSNDDLKQKLGVLTNWCDEVGRNYSEIENTTMRAVVTGANEKEIEEDIQWYMNRFRELGRSPPTLEQFKRDRFVGTIDEVVEQINEVKEIGVPHVILTVNTDNTRNAIGSIRDKLK